MGQLAGAALSTPYIPTRRISSRIRNLNPFASKRPKTPKNSSKPSLSNPILQNFLESRNKESLTAPSDPLTPPTQAPPTMDTDTSIFNPDYQIPGFREGMNPEEKTALQEQEKSRQALRKRQYDAQLAANQLDPLPTARRNFERKMVIQSLRRRGRITQSVHLARTERESLFRSRNLPTSTKKLTKLMNQLAGKTLEEAFIQLRFSGKRAAQDVVRGLEIARDRAVVERGMGLGMGTVPDGTRWGEKGEGGREIELKDGSRKKVTDTTAMYVDQAWVGKGPQWKSREFRARGKVNLLTHRTSSFSVVLKEEKTRIRLSEQIKKKREERKVWQPLPDRKVQAQRQYCLW
ncbi:ribosomal protein L22/L17 [Dendryphion nanum]|uniref:Ribosomal protein L22/L17 n=1 Tax=Dendryphion nanum TaxID=256645 RepID=A0A9P9ED40_9PLEO|nr:ribosomal protein L22/L17 [Dendryphion nanum]